MRKEFSYLLYTMLMKNRKIDDFCMGTREREFYEICNILVSDEEVKCAILHVWGDEVNLWSKEKLMRNF